MLRAWALCVSLILLFALGQAKEEDNSQVACNTDLLSGFRPGRKSFKKKTCSTY